MQYAKLRRCVAVLSVAVAGVVLAADTPTDTSNARMTVLKDQAASPGTVRISKILTVTVRDPAGNDVGHITDVVLNRDRSEIAYVALAQGMMNGRKVFAVPYAAVQYGGPNDSDLHLKVPADALAKATPIDEDQFPMVADSSLQQWLNTNITPTAQPAGMQMKPEELAAAPTTQPSATIWAERSSMLIGSKVISTNGDGLGVLKDIVVDRSTGRVDYAVLGKGSDLYAIPINGLSAQAEKHRLVMDMTSDELSNMPTMDSDHWPGMVDPRWNARNAPAQPAVP